MLGSVCLLNFLQDKLKETIVEYKPTQGLNAPVQTGDQSMQGEHAKLAGRYYHLLVNSFSCQGSTMQDGMQFMPAFANMLREVARAKEKADILILKQHISIKEMRQELAHYQDNPIVSKMQKCWAEIVLKTQQIVQDMVRGASPERLHDTRGRMDRYLQQAYNDAREETGDDPQPPAAQDNGTGDCVIY